jgi:hypothetical protein
MKYREKGFTTVELIISVSIMAVVGVAAAMATSQVCAGTENSNNSITAVRQGQNAGYWISRDAQIAHDMVTENLTAPDFLVIKWTEWDENDDPIYHTATYFLDELDDGVGKLKRNHWSSAGANEDALIAEHIYYDLADPDETSKVEYQDPELTVKLTTIFEGTIEVREYRIIRRPTL